MPASVAADTDPEWLAFAGVPMFATLPPPTLWAVWDRSIRRHTPAGDVIFRRGDRASTLVVLLHGALVARVETTQGRVITLGSWQAPAALDKVALLTGGTHTATAYATRECVWRTITRTQLQQLVDDIPALCSHVLQVLAERASQAQRDFVAATTLPTVARLASWLLKEAAGSSRTTIQLSDTHEGTQEGIARALGVTRVSINRALHRLVDEQLIELHDGSIQLLAPEALSLRAMH